LKVWTRGDLIKGFLDLSSGILPRETFLYKIITDLIFTDPIGMPKIGDVNYLIEKLLNIDNFGIKPIRRKRDISAVCLYINIIIGGYRNSNNFYSIIQVLTHLLILILNLVDKSVMSKINL
jgi:hypothetical protein